MSSYIFTGRLMHNRRTPIRNSFTYPVFNLLLDLDDLPELDRALTLFGYNRPNVVAIHSHNHLGDPRRDLKTNITDYLDAHDVEPGGKIYLLTNPHLFGYCFNPVSFYYCHHVSGELACMIAEVSNTFGEQHPYLLSPACALPSSHKMPSHRYWADKRFYVSPFIPMEARYEFDFSPLGDAMYAQIDEFRAGEKFFQARLWGRRQPLTNRSLLRTLLRYPFMTLQVFGLIHWQALKLKRLKAPWFDHTAVNR